MNLAEILDFLEPTVNLGWDVRPEIALRYLQDKGLRVTFSYADIAAEEHAAAFTIAKMLDADLLGDVKASLELAMANGTPFREWADSIIPTLQAKGWWGRKAVVDPLTGQTVVAQLGSPSRLSTIFRTNLQSAYAVGQWQQIALQADDAPYLLYDAVDDDRTRPLHASWDGLVLPVRSEFWRTHYPPNGWNCFPPDQAVSGRFEVGLKAWYSGPMTQLTTREGRSLTVTANHPVLTDNGWVAAGALNEGDRLLAYCGEVERVSLRGVDHQNSPASAHDVFEALAANGMPRAIVPSRSPLDLYGDMRFSDGHIDVVGTDRVLRFSREAGTDQRGDDSHLAISNSLAHSQVAGGSASRPLAKAALTPPASTPCLAELPLDRSAVSGGPLESLLLGGGAQDNPLARDEAADGAAAEPGLLRKAQEAFAGAVAFDDVIAVRRFDWTGHVYDFQTDSGFIVAGGIVTSNCRCSVIQLSKDDLAELGMSVSKAPAKATYTWTNPRTGKVEKIPVGVDPGFNFNPGQGRLDQLTKLALEKARAMPKDARAAALKGLQATEQAAQAVIDRALAEGTTALALAIVEVQRLKSAQGLKSSDLLAAAQEKAAQREASAALKAYKEAVLAGDRPSAKAQAAFDALPEEARLSITEYLQSLIAAAAAQAAIQDSQT